MKLEANFPILGSRLSPRHGAHAPTPPTRQSGAHPAGAVLELQQVVIHGRVAPTSGERLPLADSPPGDSPLARVPEAVLHAMLGNLGLRDATAVSTWERHLDDAEEVSHLDVDEVAALVFHVGSSKAQASEQVRTVRSALAAGDARALVSGTRELLDLPDSLLDRWSKVEALNTWRVEPRSGWSIQSFQALTAFLREIVDSPALPLGYRRTLCLGNLAGSARPCSHPGPSRRR